MNAERAAIAAPQFQNLYLDLRYYGSAARTPHVQGIMVEYPLVTQPGSAWRLQRRHALEQAACVEPLAIALHAVARAGNLLGKRVFVSGAGQWAASSPPFYV